MELFHIQHHMAIWSSRHGAGGRSSEAIGGRFGASQERLNFQTGVDGPSDLVICASRISKANGYLKTHMK